MSYDSPGRADTLSTDLRSAWNAKIAEVYERLRPNHTRFFTLDVDAFDDPAIIDGVSWPGDPLEPTKCGDISPAMVRTLSDWSFEGRHALQNEYCEYVVLHQPDDAGRLRPKRVQITTELREYWMCLAIHDPERLREVASETLGREVAWRELYGIDPRGLNDVQREVRFAAQVAGSAGLEALEDQGVPRQPAGALNRQNALFMTHPINGLDDLIFIVLFGAQRFAVRDGDGFIDAGPDDIFTDSGGKELACRHADPTAALGAYGAVREHKQLAFLNPLGMYLRGLSSGLLSFDGAPLPSEWVRWGRGEQGMHQRLELGPGDEDDVFLDDIVFSGGAQEEPLVGGHQLVGQIDVGPLLAAVDTPPATEGEFHWVAKAEAIDCQAVGVCGEARRLKARFEATAAAKPRPRIAPGG